ncbi:DUF429 domain-containing protein [Salinigranum halophilum]|uniref:DUF429 domain-containing protein n=1 Tax=Salinigranum halophilum TaxID=2565931 RepID=UPI0010A83CBA
MYRRNRPPRKPVPVGVAGSPRLPWIREANEFLSEYPHARRVVLEAHPEVCFHELDVDTRTHISQIDSKWATSYCDSLLVFLVASYALSISRKPSFS